MNEYFRLERVRAKITILVITGKNEAMINFTTEDHSKRFADLEWKDMTGSDSKVFQTLRKAFDEDRWVTLVLERKETRRDWVKRVE